MLDVTILTHKILDVTIQTNAMLDVSIQTKKMLTSQNHTMLDATIQTHTMLDMAVQTHNFLDVTTDTHAMLDVTNQTHKLLDVAILTHPMLDNSDQTTDHVQHHCHVTTSPPTLNVLLICDNSLHRETLPARRGKEGNRLESFLLRDNVCLPTSGLLYLTDSANG